LAIKKATDTITVVEGYYAMRIFLETIWRCQGESEEEIELVLVALNGRMGRRSNPRW
jgi:hypothetical protein